jgi:hypothetical protein
MKFSIILIVRLPANPLVIKTNGADRGEIIPSEHLFVTHHSDLPDLSWV